VIREAGLVAKETKRSLEMFDQFMSRSLHHLRTPLHVLQSTCDLVLENLRQIQQQETENADDKMAQVPCKRVSRYSMALPSISRALWS
jgi:signal transduction histidine kinase